MALRRHGERFYEAELYRIQGVLLLRSAGAVSEAENCFQRALAVARRRKTQLLELRAAIDLSRLWKETHRRQEARQFLGEVYGRFTEGFDTTDGSSRWSIIVLRHNPMKRKRKKDNGARG